MSLKFYLDKGSVFAFFRKQKNGHKVELKYFPEISAGSKDWNEAKQRFKEVSQDNIDKNKTLNKVELSIKTIIDKHDFYSLTKESMAELLETMMSGVKITETPFFAYCDQFYEDKKKLSGFERNKSIQTTINILKEYSPNLVFEKVDHRFFREYIQYLNSKQYSKNYIAKQVSNIRRIISQATSDRINTNMDFKEFKSDRENVYNIYLNEKEIEAIYNVNLKLTDDYKADYQKYIGDIPADMTPAQLIRILSVKIIALERARKLFVIGCWTGLRSENYLSIDPDIQVSKDGKFINAVANKNGPKLMIPIHKIVKEIIADGFPQTVSPQKLNEHVKTLGRLAGLNENIIFTRTTGGTRKTIVKKKWEMITTHTARRSFATNLFMKDVPPSYIRAVTGHKTEREFSKYIKAEPEQISRKLADYDVWGFEPKKKEKKIKKNKEEE